MSRGKIKEHFWVEKKGENGNEKGKREIENNLPRLNFLVMYGRS